jgi:hypothetical protein
LRLRRALSLRYDQLDYPDRFSLDKPCLKIFQTFNFFLNLFPPDQIQPARLAFGLFHLRPGHKILKGSKMFDFPERRKISRSSIDPAKWRKEFWAMKLAEHERLEKIYGPEKSTARPLARRS